jgi:hypothetical protein
MIMQVPRERLEWADTPQTLDNLSLQSELLTTAIGARMLVILVEFPLASEKEGSVLALLALPERQQELLP